MTDETRPLSLLVAQGWELVSYSAAGDPGHYGITDCFLLRRQKQHKLLKVRRKHFGGGHTATETDV
jgi:hypothetical protein